MHRSSVQPVEDPTLHQLRAFIAVAQHGSYTEAAKSMGVGPSLIWKAVDRLQEKVGATLIESERRGHSARTSRDGKTLLELAMAVTAAADQFLAAAADLHGGNSQRLRLGCSPAHLRAGVAHALKRFLVDHPAVTIELSQVMDDQRGDLFGRLLQNEVDVIVAPSRTVERNRFIYRDLYRWWLVALLPSGRGKQIAPINIRDLEGEPLLLRPHGFHSRAIIDAQCQRAGFEPKVAYETPSADALLSLWSHGHGVAIVPHDVLPEEIAAAASPILSHTKAVLGWRYRAYARLPRGRSDRSLADLLDELETGVSQARSPAAVRLERMAKQYKFSGTFV